MATSVSWADLLAHKGWPYVAIATPEPAIAVGRTRPLLALIAARTSLNVVEVPEVPWPERVIGARMVSRSSMSIRLRVPCRIWQRC